MKYEPIFSNEDSVEFTPPDGYVALYGLLDEHKSIRYVGKTIYKVGDRLNTHWWRSRRDKAHYSQKELWLRSLSSKPEVTLLGLVTLEEWQRAETAWINDLRAVDDELLNTASGGYGHDGGWTHTAETKERIGRQFRGRKRSIKAIEATAAAHRGAKRSAETGRKISESKLGKPWSQARRDAFLSSNQGAVSCICEKGPFKSAWGLLQHRRQVHDSV